MTSVKGYFTYWLTRKTRDQYHCRTVRERNSQEAYWDGQEKEEKKEESYTARVETDESEEVHYWPAMKRQIPLQDC